MIEYASNEPNNKFMGMLIDPENVAACQAQIYLITGMMSWITVFLKEGGELYFQASCEEIRELYEKIKDAMGKRAVDKCMFKTFPGK